MENDLPLVKTKAGPILGLKSEDGNYNMFLGVPYGKVLEENPFGLSVPYPVFDQVYEANDDSKVSPQLEEFNNTIIGTLDCLRLNIHVPNSLNKLPVMVWVHGGRFEFGFGGLYVYGPKYLVRHDVIFITINYRVGPYGFMCLDIPKVPGNQGIRDVCMALRWIKQNIEYFGGDKNNITVCGHSAGAVIVETFLTIEENLFNKMILMSGSTFRPDIITNANKLYPIRLAANLGFQTENCVQALEYLEKIDPILVIKSHTETKIRLRPTFEKKFDSVEQIIPENFKSLSIAKSKKIPIIIGNASAEAMLEICHKTQDVLENCDIFNENLNKVFKFYPQSYQKDLERITRNFYIGDEKMGKKVMWELSDFFSDFNFIFPTQKRIQSFLENDLNKIYFYVFSYLGTRNFAKKKYEIFGGGASHADDIGYIFDLSFDKECTANDQLTIDRMTSMWTNFAKYGDPTPKPSKLISTKWLPVSEDTMHYLDIGDRLTAGTGPVHQRMAFWDLFFKTQQEYIK